MTRGAGPGAATLDLPCASGAPAWANEAPAPVLYYGVEAPEPVWARAFTGHLVLQPYHPLVAVGGFADTFPCARRYVYCNPTAVPLDDPGIAALSLVAVEHDWGLARLDLRSASNAEYIVRSAMAALASDDGQVHGLFIDDVDLLIASVGADSARAHLRQIRTAASSLWPGRRVGVFLNRGFELWPDTPGLDAVLCEEMTPAEVEDMGPAARSWVQAEVLPALEALHRRRIPAFGLTYHQQDVPSAATAQARSLARGITATVRTNRKLDMWTGVL